MTDDNSERSKAFVESIERLVNKGNEVQFHHMPGDPPTWNLVQLPDGTTHWRETSAYPRKITAFTLKDLISFAIANKDNDSILANPVIFYGMNWVELVFDFEQSAERMRWSSDWTEEYLFFLAAKQKIAGERLSVSDAVEEFDMRLRTTMPSPDFINKIKQLKVVDEQRSDETRDATSSMVGGIKTTQVDDMVLPIGTYKFNVRPLADALFDDSYALEVYVRVDLEQRKWVFKPLESSWNHLLHMARKTIEERILGHFGRADGTTAVDKPLIPVVCGSLSQDQPE